MDLSKPNLQQENQPPATDLSEKMKAVKLNPETQNDSMGVDDSKATKTPKPKHRRVAGLKLKATAKPASSDGLRRFALRASPSASDTKDEGSIFRSPGFVSKELPKLHVSDRISEWRGFELERTPEAMLDLESDSVPYKSWPHFLTQIYEAIASGPDGTICEDRYLIFSHVTRAIMHGTIDPARRDGTIPKAARFTHFVPSNLLIVKIPVDCHSSAGFLDFVLKPVVGWAYAAGLSRELKLCGNTRYIAKIRESAVEGVPDFETQHPALRQIAATNPGIALDGFGSFNECDAAFRPFRRRPNKFDTPSVVVESSFGSDFSTLRYKACWWLQLMGGEVRAVILINVDPSEQEVVIEVWRNEEEEACPAGAGGGGGSDEEVCPTRVQRVVVAKKDEFKGCKEEANGDHYKVEGGPLTVAFEDFFLEGVDPEVDPTPEDRWDLVVFEETLAQEAADLWYGDGEIVNDWVEGVTGVEGTGA